MTSQECWERFSRTKQASAKLDFALVGYFEFPQGKYHEEYGKYLRYRLRSSCERLMESGRTDRLEILLSEEWVGRDDLEYLLASARRHGWRAALVRLLIYKSNTIGFPDREWKW